MKGRRSRNDDNRGDEQDTWIWGNNRGGGGAPVKDQYGSPIADIRRVLVGEVRTDYSPTPAKQHSNNRRDYGREDYDDGDDRQRQIPGLESHYQASPAQHRRGGGAITGQHAHMNSDEIEMKRRWLLQRYLFGVSFEAFRQ